eukprot:gene3669-4223_t
MRIEITKNEDVVGSIPTAATESQQAEATLAVVLSRGDLVLFGEDDGLLTERARMMVAKDTDTLALSLDWADSNNVACSFSDGSLAIVDVNKCSGGADGQIVGVTNEWKAHDYEAWIVAVDRFDTTRVMSGGDDSLFKIWDTRDTTRPTVTKRCDMGVTSIHSHPTHQHIVAQGSYDELLRVWDLRAMRQPLSTTESLGGGVWRIKWHPTLPDRVVTACMAGGFHIIKYDESFTQPEKKCTRQEGSTDAAAFGYGHPHAYHAGYYPGPHPQIYGPFVPHTAAPNQVAPVHQGHGKDQKQQQGQCKREQMGIQHHGHHGFGGHHGYHHGFGHHGFGHHGFGHHGARHVQSPNTTAGNAAAAVVGESTYTPSVKCQEADGEYIIIVELPGMKKEQINIEVKGRKLIISGEKLVGFPLGKFSAKFKIPRDTNIQTIKATFQDSILTLTTPKIAQETHKICIE